MSVERDPHAATRVGMDVLPRLAGTPSPDVGRQIAGYRLVEELGRGGMGVVYRAEHVHLGRTAALKVLAPELAEDPVFRERFVRESRAVAALDHPHVVGVHDAGEDAGLLYLAMQYIDGVDLAAMLREGPMPAGRAIALLAQVASALDAAHAAGLVHRDVKPGNVLVREEHAYLADFGLAKRASSRSGLTAIGQVVGSTEYLAPEQVDGSGFDARTDIYALGCVLFHAVTGTPPFRRESDLEVLYAHLHAPAPSAAAAVPGLPLALDAVVARALAKDPRARHPSASALAADALAALSAGPAADVAADPGRIMIAAGPTVRALVHASLAGTELIADDVAEGAAVDAARALGAGVVVLEAGVDGPETCRELRAAGARVVSVAPRRGGASAEDMLAAGADTHLAVPFSAAQLVVKLREARA